MRHTTRGFKRTPKVTPELVQHRAVRAEFLAAMDKLQGKTPEPPPPRDTAPEGYCYCGSPLMRSGMKLICMLGLHDD
ncbi:hypothetical protein ACLEPN_37835 [Myxococcus sp. 1LA]